LNESENTMTNPLQTYLHDHLAGASLAIDLVGFLRDEHAGEPLGRFAAELLTEIEADRATLIGLAIRVGTRPGRVKQAAAWLAEKASRLKFSRASAAEFGTFEALEFLALGILGKRLLWRALRTALAGDPRAADVDFDELATRAEAQFDAVEERRLEFARRALGAARSA
jgi:hypothetical protein